MSKSFGEDWIKKARDKLEAMSEQERAEMCQAQRQSWVRGMNAKCEHGMLDFEQCPDCRDRK